MGLSDHQHYDRDSDGRLHLVDCRCDYPDAAMVEFHPGDPRAHLDRITWAASRDHERRLADPERLTGYTREEHERASRDLRPPFDPIAAILEC